MVPPLPRILGRHCDDRNLTRALRHPLGLDANRTSQFRQPSLSPLDRGILFGLSLGFTGFLSIDSLLSHNGLEFLHLLPKGLDHRQFRLQKLHIGRFCFRHFYYSLHQIFVDEEEKFLLQGFPLGLGQLVDHTLEHRLKVPQSVGAGVPTVPPLGFSLGADRIDQDFQGVRFVSHCGVSLFVHHGAIMTGHQHPVKCRFYATSSWTCKPSQIPAIPFVVPMLQYSMESSAFCTAALVWVKSPIPLRIVFAVL